MLDDAVLAGGVGALQDDEDRPAIVGPESVLQSGKSLNAGREHLLGVAFVDIEPAGVVGIEIGQAEAIALADAVALDDLGGQHALSSPCLRPSAA